MLKSISPIDNCQLSKGLLFPLLFWSSVQFNCSVLSDSLRSHGLQHTRLLCPSPTPTVYSNSCPLSQWCHPTISPSVIPFSSCLQSFPASGSFQMCQFFAKERTWPKYWGFSFSISPSNEYSGLISFRMDWLDLLIVQVTLKFSPTPWFKSINSSVFSFLYSPTLTSIHTFSLQHPFHLSSRFHTMVIISQCKRYFQNHTISVIELVGGSDPP